MIKKMEGDNDSNRALAMLRDRRRERERKLEETGHAGSHGADRKIVFLTVDTADSLKSRPSPYCMI